MKCACDGRKNCESFIKLPNWTDKWLQSICQYCPMGKGYPVEFAKQIEEAEERDKEKQFIICFETVAERIEFAEKIRKARQAEAKKAIKALDESTAEIALRGR